MDDPFGMLLFFALFEILGGAALGAALRGFLKRDFSGIFFLIWGGGFAGIPFIIGAAMFLSEHQYGYFYALLFILLMPIVTVALLPEDFMQMSNLSGAEGLGIVGAVLLMLGGTVVLLNLRAGVGIAMVIGGIIALGGVYLLLRTAIGILRAP